jgi:hypothetical protein
MADECYIAALRHSSAYRVKTAGDNQDAGDKAKDESVPAEVKAEQPMMPPQMVPQFGADVIPGMKQDIAGLGIPMDITGSDVDPAVQVYAGMKGALAMELEPVEETLALMREVCAPSWRDQATELMTGTPFPKLVKLHELKESAMAAGLCPGAGIDPLADRAHALGSCRSNLARARRGGGARQNHSD